MEWRGKNKIFITVRFYYKWLPFKSVIYPRVCLYVFWYSKYLRDIKRIATTFYWTKPFVGNLAKSSWLKRRSLSICWYFLRALWKDMPWHCANTNSNCYKPTNFIIMSKEFIHMRSSKSQEFWLPATDHPRAPPSPPEGSQARGTRLGMHVGWSRLKTLKLDTKELIQTRFLHPQLKPAKWRTASQLNIS